MPCTVKRYQGKPYELHVLLPCGDGHCGQFLLIGIWLNHQACRSSSIYSIQINICYTPHPKKNIIKLSSFIYYPPKLRTDYYLNVLL